MSTFTETLNFSSNSDASSAIELYANNRDFGYYYDNLCLYCANNNIDINLISDDEFDAAAEIMMDHGTAKPEIQSYFFWID